MVKLGVLIAMENCLEQIAGKSVAAKVMEGSEQMTEKTDKKKIAQWVKGVIERLDTMVDEETRSKVMQNCGYNCANKNQKIIERAVVRRRKFTNVEDFLAAEQKNPMKGTKLAREGKILFQFYTPQALADP